MKASIFASALSLLLLAGPSGASEPGMVARLSCQREAVPGRVSCEVEIEATRGSVSWGDVVVTRAPRFVQALRARVGPREARERSDRRLRLPVALVATENGEGRLEARARAVLCVERAGARSCAPFTREVRARVVVGPIDDTR